MRTALAIILGLGIAFGLFFGMESMTSLEANNQKLSKETPQLVFLREKRDSDLKEKTRRIPKKEPKKKLEKPIKTKIPTNTQKNTEIKPMKLQPIKLSKISSLEGAKLDLGSSFIDASMLNAVKRVNPMYPRRAKLRKIEGYVSLAFKIDSNGYVKDIKILESNPADVFDKAAIKALSRWRFKPDKSLGKGFQNASISFNFKLTQ